MLYLQPIPVSGDTLTIAISWPSADLQRRRWRSTSRRSVPRETMPPGSPRSRCLQRRSSFSSALGVVHAVEPRLRDAGEHPLMMLLTAPDPDRDKAACYLVNGRRVLGRAVAAHWRLWVGPPTRRARSSLVLGGRSERRSSRVSGGVSCLPWRPFRLSPTN